MHTGQKSASDFRRTYAHRAETCPRSQADLCTPGINMPQVSGRLMHTGHKHAPDYRQIYAPRALICPRFQAVFCTPETTTVIFQTDESISGTQCCKYRSHNRKTKMNCPEIQTGHAVSRIPCPKFQPTLFCSRRTVLMKIRTVVIIVTTILIFLMTVQIPGLSA